MMSDVRLSSEHKTKIVVIVADKTYRYINVSL